MHLKGSSAMKFLAVVLLAGSIIGCSANYDGERLLWKAQQLSNPIVKDPTKATGEQYQSAKDAFAKVITRAPGTIWAGRAQLAIGSLYAMQKNYDEARKSYALVLQNYNRHQDICLGARLAKARTYEVEKNFDEAINSYNEIVDYHPWSGIGLASPLYTGRLFAVRQDKEKAKEAYQRAVKQYGKLIPDAPSPELEAQAKGYLAQAYESLGEWDNAIKILQELINAPSGVNRPLALVMLGSIYQLRLNDADKAAMYYTKLINEFPDHQLVKLAKAQLEKMGRPVPGAGESDSAK